MKMLTAFVFASLLASALLGCEGKPRVSVDSFYRYDRSLPLEATKLRVAENNLFTRYHVTYLSANGQTVPGFLNIPRSGKPPYPAIIYLHGLGDSKSSDYIELGTAIFTAGGFAVLTIDIQYHGERRREWARFDLKGERRYTTRDAIVQTVIDLRRGIDFLESEEAIDSGRIGFLGISLGGIIGSIFAGLDERVKAPILTLAGGGLRWSFGFGSLSGEMRDYLNVIEPLNFIAKVSPRPLLMINATKDEVIPRISAEMLYRRAGRPKEIKWFDTKHREIPPKETLNYCLDWFEKHLKGSQTQRRRPSS